MAGGFKIQYELRAGVRDLEGNFYYEDKNLLDTLLHYEGNSAKQALTLTKRKKKTSSHRSSVSRFCLFYVATLEYM